MGEQQVSCQSANATAHHGADELSDYGHPFSGTDGYTLKYTNNGYADKEPRYKAAHQRAYDRGASPQCKSDDFIANDGDAHP
jgi:hypothetical protein